MKARAKFKGIELKKGFSKGKSYTIEFEIEACGRSYTKDRIKVSKWGDNSGQSDHYYPTLKKFLEEWDLT